MNISNQMQTSTNFKGVNLNVAENFFKLSRPLRKNIANNWNTLERSEVVDLLMIGDKLGIEIKKPIKSVYYDFKSGDKLTFEYADAFKPESFAITCQNVNINGNKKEDVVLDFGFNDIAERLCDAVNLKEVNCSEAAPILGVIIDSFYKIEKSIAEINKTITGVITG